MNHNDHVKLLRGGVPTNSGVVWTDLGAGTGAFTLALADLLGAGGTIYAVDQNAGTLAQNQRAMAVRFPAVTLHTRVADFTGALDLPALDGIVMANALHFVPDREKDAVLRRIRDLLTPGGRLIMVEYNTDRGNRWVPHPMSYATWARLAARAGFVDTAQIATHPSSFLGRFFAALSFAP